MTETNETRRRSTALPWLLFLCTAAALAAVVYLGRGWLESERSQNAGHRKSLDDMSARFAELDATKTALEAKVRALEAEKSTLAESMSALSADLEEAEAELARIKATYDQLEQKMDKEIQKGEIRLSQLEGRIKVDLVDKVLFDSGQAELSPRGIEVLTRLAGILATIDDKQIQVSGHTDDSPIVNDLKERFPTNWELSSARAVNVVRFLSEQGKVSPKRLLATGHGPFQPVASNATPKGRAQNRRIEILLVPAVAKTKVKVKPVAQGGAK